jgi:hypothetical protein
MGERNDGRFPSEPPLSSYGSSRFASRRSRASIGYRRRKGIMLFWLIVGHAVADYPLQGDFLARAKNRAAPIPGFPWWQALWAHAAMHAGSVALVIVLLTGSHAMALSLAAAEFFAHFATDDLKCTGKIGLNTDQAIHIACKVLWAVIAGGLA